MRSFPAVKNSLVCFGCGRDNEAGFRLVFEDGGEGRLSARFTPRGIHQGWEGFFHGGLMATLLDEIMLAHLYHRGHDAATASIEVRYRAPVRVGEALVVTAWEDSRRGAMFRMRAEARREGEVVAQAVAKCMEIPKEGTSRA